MLYPFHFADLLLSGVEFSSNRSRLFVGILKLKILNREELNTGSITQTFMGTVKMQKRLSPKDADAFLKVNFYVNYENATIIGT